MLLHPLSPAARPPAHTPRAVEPDAAAGGARRAQRRAGGHRLPGAVRREHVQGRARGHRHAEPAGARRALAGSCPAASQSALCAAHPTLPPLPCIAPRSPAGLRARAAGLPGAALQAEGQVRQEGRRRQRERDGGRGGRGADLPLAALADGGRAGRDVQRREAHPVRPAAAVRRPGVRGRRVRRAFGVGGSALLASFKGGGPLFP